MNRSGPRCLELIGEQHTIQAALPGLGQCGEEGDASASAPLVPGRARFDGDPIDVAVPAVPNRTGAASRNLAALLAALHSAGRSGLGLHAFP
jgi:hypothetical protein